MKRLFLLLTLLFLMIPNSSFSETIDVLIKGMDDGIKTNKQQDHKEALMNAKLQAIERAGMEITAITKVVNFQTKYDMVESKAKAVLLPGFQVLDMGYQTDGSYQVVLSGKVKSGKATSEVAFGPYTLHQKWKTADINERYSHSGVPQSQPQQGGTKIKSTYVRGKYQGTTYEHTPERYDGRKDTRGKSYEQLMYEGFEAYENKDFNYARNCFGAAWEIRKGAIEPNVWDVKSRYQNEKGFGKSHSDAGRAAVSTANMYLRSKPNHPVLNAMKKRMERGYSADTFSLEAYYLFEEGLKAYRNDEVQKAHDLMKECVKLDPQHAKGYRYWGMSTQRLGKRQEGRMIFCEGYKKNPDDRNLKKMSDKYCTDSSAKGNK